MEESRVLEVLLKMASTLLWVKENQPAQAQLLPQEHKDAIKHLEDMGIVTRRNHHLLSLQKQRLHRLMRRELLRCPKLKDRCLSEFNALFENATF